MFSSKTPYLFSEVSILCFLLFIVLQGCSAHKHVSEYFKYNQYKKDFNQLVSNDSVKILHQSFGDVEFITNKKKLNKVASKALFKPDNVLFYGKTVLPPYYEYFISVDSEKEIEEEGIYTRDTLVNGHRYKFIGIPEEGQGTPKDFSRLSGNFFVLKGNGNSNKKKPIGAFMNQFLKENTFYKSMDRISKYEAVGESEEWFRYQMELNYASFLGESEHYRNLLKKFEGDVKSDAIVETIEEKGVSGIELVKEFVIENVKGRKLIMFNENHFYPSHRILLTELLPELKAAGFNYLAMEAIAQGEDKKLNKGEGITLNTGFYTKEQRFVELIQLAQKSGIKLVSYESQNKDRETGQVDNLYNKTYKNDPEAKVIVYAGISHILEEPDSRGKKWMANLFKEKYHIDPVTFSQTGLLQYRKYVDEIAVIRSSEFYNDRLKGVDFQIVNNLSISEVKGNFSYHNDLDFTVQLSVFNIDKVDRGDFVSRVPIRVALLDSGADYIGNLGEIKNVKVILTDEDGIIFREEDIKISDR